MSAGGQSPTPGADPAAEAALAAAGEAGIHTVAIPTPFLIGRVNCYLIQDDPLTLVDTGPNSGKTLDELEQGLAKLGHRVEDLGLIVITHQHMDHVGLLEILVRRSGAEVAALDLLGPYLADFSAAAAADDAFSSQIMRRHGVPPEVVTVLEGVGASFRGFGSSAPVTVPLHDGGELALRDRTLRVSHRPGHSPSDTVLHDEQRRLLIGGDHLLSRVSSNPLITRPLGDGEPDPARRPQALRQYIASMRATQQMDLDFVLGGHGPPVTDHAGLIDERLRMHERRARKLHGMLADGPRTAYDLASAMWGNVAVTQAYLTISEVLGHLDLLTERGEVLEDADGPVTHFSSTNP